MTAYSIMFFFCLNRYQASYQSVATLTQPASCFSLESSEQICERKDSKTALQKRENVEVAQTRSHTSTVTDRVGKQCKLAFKHGIGQRKACLLSLTIRLGLKSFTA